MVIHRTLIIKGKVQGVFFRASTKQQADELGVKGEVCNMADGSVAVNAEGEEEHVHALISWCHHGPARAEVKEVVIKEAIISGYKNFTVKRF